MDNMYKAISSNVPLSESYDMINVVEDIMSMIAKLKDDIDNNKVSDLKEISKQLSVIYDKAESLENEAW